MRASCTFFRKLSHGWWGFLHLVSELLDSCIKKWNTFNMLYILIDCEEVAELRLRQELLGLARRPLLISLYLIQDIGVSDLCFMYLFLLGFMSVYAMARSKTVYCGLCDI